MNKRFSYIIAVACILVCATEKSFAQRGDDTTVFQQSRKNIFFRKFTIPVTLVALGIYGTTDNSIINHNEIKEERNEYFPGFTSKADNYLQYSPIGLVYAMDVLGLKGKHNWRQQTLLLGGAELIMTGFVVPLKKYGHILRPDSSAYNSFPSGHTAQAFLAATFFHKEFGKKYPWVSAGMFTLAGGIGAFRVLNNRHWVSDVLAGAGFGILSVELSYLLLKNVNLHKKGLPSVIIPSYGNGAFICTAIYKL